MGLGEVIRAARNQLGLTQKELAQEVGCAEVTIRQYEANRRDPSYEMCLKLENILKVPLVAHSENEAIDGPLGTYLFVDPESLVHYKGKRIDPREFAKAFSVINEAQNENQQQWVDDIIRIAMDDATQSRKDIIDEFIHNEFGLMMIDLFKKLNHDGRRKTVDYMRDLSENSKYQRTEGIEKDSRITQEKPSEG